MPMSVRLEPAESSRLEIREEVLVRRASILLGNCGHHTTGTMLEKCYFGGFGIYSENDGLPLKLGGCD